MKLTLKFTFILLFISNLCQAQFTLHRDSIYWERGLRFGCDISRFALTQLDHDRKGFEVSSDFRLTPNLYPTAELGFEQVNFNDTLVRQTSNGEYLRLGVDINLRNYVKDFSNNMIFFGFRYGISTVTYQLNNYSISDDYWGNYIGNTGRSTSYASWMEALAGVKVEVLKNIYLGWSVRGKLLLTKTHVTTFPYIIPGFGSGENTTNVGFNYSVYFQIPLMKMKTHYRVKKKIHTEPSKEPHKTNPVNSQPSSFPSGRT